MQIDVEKTTIVPRTLKDKLGESTPVIYADQIMGIAFGPFVTRLTFGVEDHANATRNATVTLVMPTNMVHAALSELTKQLSSDETRNNFETQYKEYLRASEQMK